MLAEVALDLSIMHDPTADLSLYLYIDYCDNKDASFGLVRLVAVPFCVCH